MKLTLPKENRKKDEYMEQVLGQIVEILSNIEDIHRTAEILSLGLEIKEEFYGISAIELFKKELSDLEHKLQTVISEIESNFELNNN